MIHSFLKSVKNFFCFLGWIFIITQFFSNCKNFFQQHRRNKSADSVRTFPQISCINAAQSSEAATSLSGMQTESLPFGRSLGLMQRFDDRSASVGQGKPLSVSRDAAGIHRRGVGQVFRQQHFFKSTLRELPAQMKISVILAVPDRGHTEQHVRPPSHSDGSASHSCRRPASVTACIGQTHHTSFLQRRNCSPAPVSTSQLSCLRYGTVFSRTYCCTCSSINR